MSIGQQVAPYRQLDSPVNRQAVERIQALATQNNQRRAAANIAPAQAGKPVAKAAKPDDAGDSKPAPATIRAAATSANKKQARQADPGSTDKFYGADTADKNLARYEWSLSSRPIRHWQLPPHRPGKLRSRAGSSTSGNKMAQLTSP